MNFTALDFETANRSRSSVCSVGVVEVTNGIITNEYYSLINPVQRFDSINCSIHGIYEKDVQSAPTFSEYWPALKEQLENKVVIAHNASFDMGVLRASLDAMYGSYPTIDYGCSYILAKKAFPSLHSYRLSSIADMLNIPLKHHQALDDARASAKIVLEIGSREEVTTIEELHNKMGVTSGRIYPGGYRAASGARKRVSTKRSSFYR
ncbi:3'-5' exonuclease [Jeotgalibacillus sp. ET6]|uniref:3'-5' exonuclease n=1 Tax=Jeotgalibacillus sp. ET6 TaxID=3037260 RepID=UPI0024184957|nr:3'-5' exonuclease [Jeotgalibacillus sp. ET6]MDG5470387.1 3'-5' exonuclease [Jeotgalibacillus sp. ET6]